MLSLILSIMLLGGLCACSASASADTGYRTEEIHCDHDGVDIYGIAYIPETAQEKVPLLIFSHELGNTHTSGTDYAEALAAKGIAVYVFDYPNGGYSSHGGSQVSLFGSTNGNDFKNAVDHLIERGEIKPMIIVTPTFYTERHGSISVSGSWDAVREFPDELVNYLMPAVESAYSTFAETADDAGFAASREHRAFSGFSMGSVTTWYVFAQQLRYFHDYIPISGDSWIISMQGGAGSAAQTAAALAESVHAQGDPEFFIYAITGSEDIAEPNMTPQIEAMKEADAFRYTETSRSEGNLTYQVMEGGYHDMPEVKMYLYNLLPRLWPKE